MKRSNETEPTVPSKKRRVDPEPMIGNTAAESDTTAPEVVSENTAVEPASSSSLVLHTIDATGKERIQIKKDGIYVDSKQVVKVDTNAPHGCILCVVNGNVDKIEQIPEFSSSSSSVGSNVVQNVFGWSTHTISVGRVVTTSGGATPNPTVIYVHGNADTIKTASGDVTIEGNVTGSVNTMSGSVELLHGSVQNGDVKTMSGNVKVSGSIKGKVSTMSGNITKGNNY